jgi:hypothetical protein
VFFIWNSGNQEWGGVAHGIRGIRGKNTGEKSRTVKIEKSGIPE